MHLKRSLIFATIVGAMAACGHPEPVRDVAKLTGARTAQLQLEAGAQAKAFKAARAAAKARSETLARIAGSARDIKEKRVADLEDDALFSSGQKANLALLERYRANDDAVRAAPFAFLSSASFVSTAPPSTKLDTSGLQKVIQKTEPFSKGERLSLAELIAYANAVNAELTALDEQRDALAKNEAPPS